MSGAVTWEEAIRRLRAMPEKAELVKNAYMDEDNLVAAKRFFASEECAELLTLLKANINRPPPWEVLDTGAGNGISSYAFARQGYKVYALEPDPSMEVGSGAIKRLAKSEGLDIEVLESGAEQVPLEDSSVDLVYVRQALHHASDLERVLTEAVRVLRPGGTFLATREHVVDDDKQLKEFLDSHPLHKWFGGEHAYRLEEYTGALRASGLEIKLVLAPFDTVINYFPMSKVDFEKACRQYASNKYGAFIGGMIGSKDWYVRRYAAMRSRTNKHPGRLYSFLAVKRG